MTPVPGFSVKVHRYGATAVVTPCGEVDLATVCALRVALDKAGRCAVLVLDLREMSFMDSSGVGVLVDERRARAVRVLFAGRLGSPGGAAASSGDRAGTAAGVHRARRTGR